MCRFALQCLIRYIDFGNTAIVEKSALHRLPVSLQEHRVTEHFVLSGLAKPTDNEKAAKVSLHCLINDAVLHTFELFPQVCSWVSCAGS